ncbi:MAG: ferredoxin--NADP reductase [Cyclobacteriaceae bacterium]
MKASIKIEQVIRETPDAITLELEQHRMIERYQPGQFLNFFLDIDGREVVRQYSFSSTALLNETPKVTIKRVNGGLVSNHLIDTLNPGDSIVVSAPGGRFTTSFGEHRHVLLLAGGSGITPLFSLLKSILVAEPKSQVTLLYASKTYESIIFREELDALHQKYDKFHLKYFLSSQNEVVYTSSDLFYRRVREADFQDYLDEFDVYSPEIFLCGPESFMSFSAETLNKLGVTPEGIKTEVFSGYEKIGSDHNQPNHNQPNQSQVQIKNIDGTTISFLADQNKPVLQSALEAGIRLPHSCKEAMCGTCRIKLRSGKISMKANYALQDDEVDSGYVLLCSGFPESDILDMMYG